MTSVQRREFLRQISATLGSGTLVSCGGGSAAVAPIPTPTPTPTPAPTPAPTPTPTPTSHGPMQFTLTSAVSSTFAPFTLGYAFKQGHVPQGQTLVANLVTLQVTPKNRWPDGSLKIAVLAGRASLTGGVPLTVALALGAAPRAPALTPSDLVATGVSAKVDCGSFGAATWSAVDWSCPFQSWVSGQIGRAHV